MHKLTAILATLALAIGSASAAAAPRKHHARRGPSPAKLASAAWVRDCVHERTGPTDGLSVPIATRLCKAMSRIHDAIEACEQAVVDACVDQALPDGSTDCMDEALADEFAATCFVRPDAPVAKGGK